MQHLGGEIGLIEDVGRPYVPIFFPDCLQDIKNNLKPIAFFAHFCA